MVCDTNRFYKLLFPFFHIFASDDWQVFFLMNWSRSFPYTVVIVYQMIQETWTNILIFFSNVSTDLCGFFRMVCDTNRFNIKFFFPFLRNLACHGWEEVFFLMNWSKSFPNTVVFVYQMIQKTWTNILIMFQNVSTDLCGFFRMVCDTNRLFINFSYSY
jgi:hypothetical protein